jgi:hypothetical protein
MPESVLPRPSGLLQKFGGAEGGQGGIEVGAGQAGHGGEDPGRERPADHRGGLQHGSVPLGEAVDAGRQDGLDAGGHADLPPEGAGEAIGARGSLERAVLG